MYSYQYWKTLAQGYEAVGAPVPQHVIDGMEEAHAALNVDLIDWIVIDDAGREAARVQNKKNGDKPWAKNILNPTLQAFNIFTHGPTSQVEATWAPEHAQTIMGGRYLDIKYKCDTMWQRMLDVHRKTKRFSDLAEWMTQHGNRNHSYPKEVEQNFCTFSGWEWTPKMGVGSGTTVHLQPDELPEDCLVVVTGCMLTVVNGKLYVPTDKWLGVCRGGTRAVYGYWLKP